MWRRRALFLASILAPSARAQNATTNGTYGLALSYTNASCPAGTFYEGAGLQANCCPDGTVAAPQGSVYCCPSSDDCRQAVLDSPHCANTSWTYYSPEGFETFGWCCLPDWTGYSQTDSFGDLEGGGCSPPGVALNSTQHSIHLVIVAATATASSPVVTVTATATAPAAPTFSVGESHNSPVGAFVAIAVITVGCTAATCVGCWCWRKRRRRRRTQDLYPGGLYPLQPVQVDQKGAAAAVMPAAEESGSGSANGRAAASGNADASGSAGANAGGTAENGRKANVIEYYG